MPAEKLLHQKTDIVLELKNVTVSFPSNNLSNNDTAPNNEEDVILKNISLQVKHGETLGIIGPSGGGKTVLLKTMAGLYTPKSGHVYCEGEDWQNLQSAEKRKLALHIGMLFQRNALFDSLTAAENIAFPIQEHMNWSEEKVDLRVRECLTAVGLLDAYSKLPHELSGGMRQRLAIARSIALNPEINFYDDPTAGLDPINTDKMIELLMNLKAQFKSTVLLVTHNLACAYKMSDRIVLVANQEVIETGTPEQTQNHPDPRVQQFIQGKLAGPLQWG